MMKQKLNQYGITDPTMLDEVGLYQTVLQS